ncbi:MAG: hypothetical protein B7X06_04395 [Verrucomicrobia bacterium 21-51-4]|nr:MAG: hypothetical protein B7X06_04395 [Verrucomicrobia bacterium 21-51-4]HQU08962.1 DNA polymerase III subunit gamma/tau [Opitutales bacterium]
MASDSTTKLHEALHAQRLGHAITLYGDHLDSLEKAALDLAAAILNTSAQKVLQHPDFHLLRPANKMRQIGAEATRGLIHNLQQSAFAGSAKVALIYEADRMHTTAANAFLKTLEEPPAGTTLILITPQLGKLLPTIRSRVLAFRIPGKEPAIEDSSWASWLTDYSQWLESLLKWPPSKDDTAAWIMKAYNLMGRFEKILEALSDTRWKAFVGTLPKEIEEDILDAMEVGFKKRLRAQLMAEIAESTRTFAAVEPEQRARPFTQTIEALEQSSGFMALNLNEASSLEFFFLATLRAWSLAQKIA